MPPLKDHRTAAYRPDIDSLRALAVCSVVYFHAFPYGRLRGGFTGVDIFFVISGFLITSILARELEEGRLSVLKFYTRRVLRIFPALIVTLIASLIVGYLALFADEFAQLGKHAAGGAAFVSNLVLWSELGYFDQIAEIKPLLHLWSLGVEEQFYIVWPLALLLIWRSRLNPILAISVLGAASFAWGVYLTYADASAAFYLPFGRFWELAAGGLVALALRRRTQPFRFPTAMTVAGLGLILFGFAAITRTRAFPGFWAVLPVAGACLMIAAGNASRLNGFLSFRPFVWMGLISYPLYLWHWPLLALLRLGNYDGTFRPVALEIRIAAVVLAVVLAAATYLLIERPIRFGGRRRLWAPVLCVVMVMVAATGLYIDLSGGLPKRIALTPPAAGVLFEDYPHPQRNKDCTTVLPEMAKEWSCLLSAPRAPTVALFGDSHAHQYYEDLAEQLPGESVLNISAPGCLPFSKLRERCAPVQTRILQLVDREPSIHTVVLTGYFSFLSAGFVGGNAEGERIARPLSAQDRALYLADAERMLSGLEAHKRRVVIVQDIPDLVLRPRDCVTFNSPAMALLRGSVAALPLDRCGVPLDALLSRSKAHDEALSEILARHPQVTFYDPRPLVCRDGFCPAYRDGQFLYWNSDHLTREGSGLVMRAFVAAAFPPAQRAPKPAAPAGIP